MSDAARLVVVSPVSGRVIELADVPDPVFSAAMVGPGTAVEPALDGRATAVAPIAGTVAKLHPHAYVLTSPDGAGVLTHLGIDTVQLDGEGFELLVAEGDHVEAGAPMVSWDPAAVEAGGRSPVVPVVALDAAADTLHDLRAPGPIEAGDVVFTWAR